MKLSDLVVKPRQSSIHDTPPTSNGWNPTIDGDRRCWDPFARDPLFQVNNVSFQGYNFFIGDSNKSNHTPTVSTDKWLTSLVLFQYLCKFDVENYYSKIVYRCHYFTHPNNSVSPAYHPRLPYKAAFVSFPDI